MGLSFTIAADPRLASAVILGSKTHGTQWHILLSQIWDSPNLEGQVPVFISPRNRVAQLYSHVTPYGSQGYGGGIRPRLHTGLLELFLSYITIDGQSASLYWCEAPIWGLWPDFYYCQTVADLLMWGALSDERTGLSFTMYSVQYVYILHVVLRSFTSLI
jgi:hypothetical protein